MTDERTPPGTASHDTPVSERLAAWLTQGWAEVELPGGEDVVAPFTAARRRALSERFAGEAMVIPSGRLRTRSNDTHYDFRPGTDLAWLTGCHEPDAVLLMLPRASGHEALLFVYDRRPKPTDIEAFRDRVRGELWVGRRPSTREVGAALGIECRDLATLPALLDSLDAARTRVVRGMDAEVERMLPATDLDHDAELSTALSEMRLRKDAFEVAQLRDAVAATLRGFVDVVRRLPMAMETGERMVEGVFATRARVDGNSVGYNVIAACGANATTLHWSRNDGLVRQGDLLLLDAGVENRRLYTADITRTMPVSGRFSPRQREIYELVLRAQEAGIAAVRPGVPFKAFHQAASRVLAQGLHDMGLLTIPVEESLAEGVELHKRWTLHNTGHMLGMDVHDCASARPQSYRDGILEPGMVLTVEPGLYFQPDDLLVPEELRGIGVRIEDDVLVTDAGCEVLSSDLPKQPEHVERWMAELTEESARW
jgi:Xaa-Pro aminopeptidase